jgi:hypothetical protein
MHLRRPANEVRRVVTDYGPDPYARATADELTGEAWSRLLGYGGHVYVGDRGDYPSGQAYGGVLASPQQFVSAGPPLAANHVTYTDAQPTFDNAPTDGPTSDPVARILAARLRNQVS